LAAVRRLIVFLFCLGCSDPMDSEHDGAVDDLDLGAGRDGGPVEPVMADFVATLADPLAPARRLPGEVFLRSSRTPEPASGNTNDDLGHFLEEDDERMLLVDETGPGVITRMWFTFGGTGDDTVGDRVRAFITIDGEALAFEGESDDEPGVLLGDLTSGTLEGFPQPWVLGRDESSGGLLVQLPIHYQESFRLELDRASTEEAWAYYQVDGRTMPPHAMVPPFDPAALATAAAAASERWVAEDGQPGELVSEEPLTLAAGERQTLELDGPGAITAIEIGAAAGTRSGLTLRIVSDGAVSLDAPLAWAIGASAPAEPYHSALATVDDEVVRFAYPIPFAEQARIEVVADEATEVALAARLLTLDEAPGPDLGRLVSACGESRVDIDESICEQVPEVQYPNVVVAELEGPAQYAGQSFYADTPGSWWWMLEADHEVFVDGDYPMLGTGTEDYFGGAFYFLNGPFSTPLVGAPGWVREDRAMTIHMFRHHLVDTIPFRDAFRFEYESYIDQTVWSGCAFGYRFDS
jgi:hypothetical protein